MMCVSRGAGVQARRDCRHLTFDVTIYICIVEEWPGLTRSVCFYRDCLPCLTMGCCCCCDNTYVCKLMRRWLCLCVWLMHGYWRRRLWRRRRWSSLCSHSDQRFRQNSVYVHVEAILRVSVLYFSLSPYVCARVCECVWTCTSHMCLRLSSSVRDKVPESLWSCLACGGIVVVSRGLCLDCRYNRGVYTIVERIYLYKCTTHKPFTDDKLRGAIFCPVNTSHHSVPIVYMYVKSTWYNCYSPDGCNASLTGRTSGFMRITFLTVKCGFYYRTFIYIYARVLKLNSSKLLFFLCFVILTICFIDLYQIEVNFLCFYIYISYKN